MQIYGILGHPVAHSLSPVIHNAGFKALNINAKYLKFDIEEKDLEKFIKNLKNENIFGLSVTVPYKEKIIQFLDKISENAKKIGAVNTIFKKNGKLIGENTDWIGVEEVISGEWLVVSGDRGFFGKKVLVLGAGGSARAVIYALKTQKAEVYIANRTYKKAEILAKEFDTNVLKIEDFEKFVPDIIVNTTILGLAPKFANNSPYPKELFRKNQIVIDLVYKPLMTKFLKDAKNAGASVITGDKILLHQAIKQFEIWTGEKAPIEVMREALGEERVKRAR